MDFNLSREHQLIRKMMAEFTEREVKPIAAETDRTCEYPRDNIEKLFKLGVMGMCVPKEYGGAGADPLASALCIEELSKQCASTGDIVATHNGLCCDPIMTYGTAEQKAKYLPMLTTGHHVGAFALTEPNAGSDASKGQTEAKLEGDHYVMNGSKIFITNGYVADVFVVFAMTDKSKGTKGISAFIVESGFPGFSVGKHEEKLGLHGSPTAEIVFQDCIVPKENLLGVEGKGFSIAMATLDGGRIGIAAQFPLSPASEEYPTELEAPYSIAALQQLTQEEAGSSGDAANAGNTSSDNASAGMYAGVSVTLLVNEENSFKVSAAQEIAAALSRCGLTVTVDSVPWETYLQRLQDGSFDLYYGECRLTADWDVLSLVGTEGSLNYGGFSDEKTDALLAACRTASEGQRSKALTALWQDLLEKMPIAPLCFKSDSVLTTTGLVEGLTATETDPFFSLEQWTVHLDTPKAAK